MSKVVAVSYQKHIFTYQSNINKNMEYTNEFLQRMYAAYMGCEVITNEGISTVHSISRIGCHTHSDVRHSRHYAFDEMKPILTPLSEISDDDAIEVAKIAQCRYQAIESIIIAGRELVTIYINRQTNVSALSWCQIIDFLRSKHYDCGYLHISSLIEAGLAVKATK
jgi:hypothetical protein